MPLPTIDELTLADESSRWEQLGFTVIDDCCQLGSVRVRFAGEQVGRGIIGWSLRDIASTELDGLPTSVAGVPADESERAPEETPTVASEGATGPSLPEPAGEHPNGVLRIDHVVVMSPAFERTVQALRAAGLDLRRIREEPTPAGAPRQAFFRLGEVILELIQQPEEAIARAGSPDQPTRFWGLALLASDLDRALDSFAPHVSEPRAAVQPGRRIATVRRSAELAVPVALMSGDERAGTEERLGQAGALATEVDPETKEATR